MKKIGFYSRKEEYGWLSNFHRSTQVVDGITYPSNEHYYQSQKATTKELHDWIRNAPAPFHAMKAGRALRKYRGELRLDWNAVKQDIMLKGLRAKFSDPDLKQKLIDTGDAYLFEESPHDKYWGEFNGKGQNHLGRLLMLVRSELV